MSKSGWFLLIPHSYQQSRIQLVINLLQKFGANLHIPGTLFHWLEACVTCLPNAYNQPRQVTEAKERRMERNSLSLGFALNALCWKY